MSRIDIQEVRTFQHALKKANATMRKRIDRVKKAALTYVKDTTLNGQAVQASKTYFQENYAPMCESLTEVLDTSEDLLESYLNDFSAQVDASPMAKIDAELLGTAVDKVKSIRRKQKALQQSLSGSTAGLHEGKAQRLRLDLANAVEQEKILEKYLHFEQSHGQVFQDLVALVMTAKQTMQSLIQDVQFNEKTGTYSMPKGYTQSLQSLKKRLDEVRGIDPKLDEELKEYKVYAVVYQDGNGKPQVMWLLEQNGVGVNNPKLKKYLEQTGKYLDPSAYQIITNDDLNKKINRSWKQGIYYMDGSKYSGALGGVLRTSAYVEDWKGKLDESGLTDVVLGLGLSVAAIRGSTTFSEKVKTPNKVSDLPKRPSWRQSEIGAEIDFPGYEAQKSFINGQEVPYGTKGSTRPELFRTGHSVEVKNYNVESNSGRNNLINNVSKQIKDRVEHLPSDTSQTILIDVRGQNVSNQILKDIRSKILTKAGTDVEIIFKR